jgi:predicted amidophosphoribosyltransferase
MTYPSYCCPKCGAQIGYIGRFFQFLCVPLHRCEETKKPYKVKIEVSECGASRWVNSNEYFFSDEGKEFLKEMSEFAKRHIKKNDKSPD